MRFHTEPRDSGRSGASFYPRRIMTSSTGPVGEIAEPRPVRYRGHGIELSADQWDGDPGRTVLFLHGGGQTRQAWGGTCRAVARLGCRVAAFDLRGHGDSGWPEDPEYDFEHFGLDVLSILDQLGAPPIAVGASLGGISLLTAQRIQPDPETQIFTGVVLVDITPRMELDGVKRIAGFMTAHPDGFESLEDAAAAIAGYMPHREPPKDTSGLSKVLRKTDDGRWRWHWDIRFITARISDRSEIEELYEERFDHVRQDMLHGAGHIRVPTCLVRGTKSDLVSEEGVIELLEALPNGRYTDVRNATHMVAGDENDAFTEVVVEFVRDAGWERG